ncbi:MAG: RNA polymerase sigma factor [Anaerolineae bacterium]|nr:RNA polymerase sigma factor [Anaerolineae bacterium]
MPDDAKLLDALRTRSPAAFQELFDLYSDRIFRLAVSLVADEMEAEEIVQEVFVRFFEKIDQFEGRSNIGTWLYRAAHNASIDILRTRKKAQTSVEIDAQEIELPMPANFSAWREVPDDAFDQNELKTQLNQAMNKMPKTLSSVFLMRDIEEYSTQQTAEILNISPGAVKVRLHRARLLLREYLAQYFSETV